MIDRFGQLAEKTAEGVSVFTRRAFLHSLSKRAAIVAGVLGGWVAFPGSALALDDAVCCRYADGTYHCTSACDDCCKRPGIPIVGCANCGTCPNCHGFWSCALAC